MINKDIDMLKLYINLTPRQREVARLVCTGMTNKEIADQLWIASSVVAEHLTNVYAELASVDWGEPGLAGKRYMLIRVFSDFFEQHPDL